ncbi:ATP-binding cassette domain-containing protein [Kitasatospora sp. YST-16]|uniref:phosphonate ABC transporter ATP-binding protein n=1 Tax=unclassified Kitasatospora TaxID=2633591 RepID=UPI0004C2B704|nr:MULTISPECIES: ATP-binding cassette domain-containing protein [unclassified Kitasatospora]WAL71485.1 ATP-binding cassette domain-containing protein [Kitasatospora sp. YST-16]WNW37525.1 ATP-binding cassette domain-containing protein [Streptomyces sp. Li-HN-5-13]
MLVLSDITVRYGDRQVLDGVHLTVPRGEFLAVLGANGCGKSTLLRAAAGLEPVAEGTVSVDGRAGDPLALAMVFQQIHLVHRRSVLDNVCAGALGRLPLRHSLHPLLFPRELREEAMACLDRVGLADRAHDRAGRLSGGQQQRVAVARALCQRPAVLLADEPVSALDPAASEQVLALLAELAHQEGLAVVAVLHQPALAARHADRVIGLREGRIVLDGAPDRDVDHLYQPALAESLS